MLSNFFAMFKIFFLQQFRIRDVVKKKDRERVANGKAKRKRMSSMLATYLILLAVATPILIIFSIALYNLGRMQGSQYGDVILSMLMLICQGFVLLYGVTSIITNVFASTDGDRLLCLPVRTSTIFMAKMSVVYVNEVIMSTFTTMFLLLPYGIGAGFGAQFYIMLVLALLLLPMLPLTLASIVAIPFAFLLRRFNNNGVFKVVMQIVLFLAFMAIYLLLVTNFMNFSYSFETDEQFEQAIAEIIKNFADNAVSVMKWILPNWWLAQAMIATTVGGVLLNFLYALGINIVLLAVVVGISILMYKSSLQGSLEQGGSRKKFAFSDKDSKNLGKKANLIFTLMTVDIKRTMRNSQLGFQMIVGIISLPLMVIIMGVVMMSGSNGGGSDKSSGIYQMVTTMILLGYLSVIAISSNGLGLYPISRENKTFYLLKTLPIPTKTLLLSKILLATIVMCAVSTVTMIVAIFMFGIKWYWAIPCLIAMALLQFATMCITTYLDIRRPTLGWVNFKQSLGNSRNTLYSVLISFLIMIVVGLIGGGFIMLYIMLKQAVWVTILMWVVYIIASGVFAFVAFRKTAEAGIRRFEEIEQ